MRELLLKFFRLFIGENVFGSDAAGPLQGRARCIVPYTLQVRIAPRRLGYCRLRRGGSFLRGLPRCRRHEYHRPCDHQKTEPTSHLCSSYRDRAADCTDFTDSNRRYQRKPRHHLLLNRLYSISSVNGTHLNSNSWIFFSIRLYRGKLIFHGRVYTLGSSIVASYIRW